MNRYLYIFNEHRYDEERNIPAVCHTSDINEELGLVTHLFADKTGEKSIISGVIAIYLQKTYYL